MRMGRTLEWTRQCDQSSCFRLISGLIRASELLSQAKQERMINKEKKKKGSTCLRNPQGSLCLSRWVGVS